MCGKVFHKNHNGYVYIYISKAMKGLLQLIIISHTQLTGHLAPFVCKPCRYTPGLWGNEIGDTTFCLVVEVFGIKYTRYENLQQIL